MDPKVEIVVCYRSGTKDFFKAWLSSFLRHTKDVAVSVITADTDSLCEAAGLCQDDDPVRHIPVDVSGANKARVHGTMLDRFFDRDSFLAREVMTMDSDCLPLTDDWMERLLEMRKNGAKVVGILHPWAPPPDDMDRKRIEWRVRSQHCWNVTHVACQMISIDDFRSLGVKFSEGDDTGLLIPMTALKMGWKVDGFKPTRCAKPSRSDGVYDPEFNRYVSVVYGDCVYHHGGLTRIASEGDGRIFGDVYEWVEKRIVENLGAEFLLQEELSYKYKFDKEEEVAREKMDRLFGTGSLRVNK